MPDIERAPGGLFLPGQAPKSPGRARGPTEAQLIRTLLEPHRDALVAKAVELAKAGDPQAMRLCLERLGPAPKQDAERVHVPGLADEQTFAGKCDAVIRAVSTGEISAEAGERVLRLLDVFRKAHETDDLARRIEVLEGRRLPAVVVVDNTGDEFV
jgi:hypothetical protein